MLTITLLGTAATMPLPDRALTAAAAECVGHSLLFDCGEGTQAAARRAREKKMQAAMLGIKKKYGKNAILKGMDLEDGATGKLRGGLIGGHKA